MAIGSFMGKTFKVSTSKVFTPKNLQGSTGSDWATHERAGKKARSQYLGPKLKTYTFDITLRAEEGVSPRSYLEYFQNKAEKGKADTFVIGNSPLSSNPFVITDISDSWDTVLNGGVVTGVTISLTIQEYV